MAVNHSTAAKNGRLQVDADLIRGLTLAASTGTASAGQLVIGTSSLSGSTGVLATIPLPANGISVSGGVLTLMSSAQSATASASGTAALAEVRNNAGTTIISGLTVNISSADIIVGTTTIASGGNVTINSATSTAV